MLKKYYLAMLALLILPIVHSNATSFKDVASITDDTIIVDKNELIDVLKGIAANEINKKYRFIRQKRQHKMAQGYQSYDYGETTPVYNTASKRVEYIPIYIPQSSRQPIYQPYLPVNSTQNSRESTAFLQETQRLQEQIVQLQKQIEALNENVQDSVIKQRVDSLAQHLSNIRTYKDTIVVETENSIGEQNIIDNYDAPTVKIERLATFDTNLRQVFFKISSAELSSEAIHTLNEVAAILKTNRNLKVELTGSSSKDGPKDFNNNLAMKRTNSVKNYLLNKNVRANQITTTACGIDKTSEMSTYARRVELCISL